ncbi:MAG: hypothetical protein GXP14_16480 [Gammaproteobacteria bacterium]|nr:hypothetical protein [Gammaproteobacteria bacterium]
MDIFKDPKFAPLQDMETFTEELFNRIFSFQEKTTPAWDESKSFDERIKKLPLHYLVFSNGDRDPAINGPTINHYYPLREEIRTLVHIAKQISKQPVILDVHPGNGFVGSLMAREGVTVIGARTPDSKPNQIKNFFDPDFYDMREQPVANIESEFDIVFSSWMPAGQNHTPAMVKHKPKLIIYTYTDQLDEQNNRICGTEAAFNQLPDNYRLAAQWDVTRPADLFKLAWPDLTANLEEVRKTKIYADHSCPDLDLSGLQAATPYDWEEELNMALLVREAKAALEQQGIKTNEE